MRGRTSLIVAHRLATVERCDVVAFLEANSYGFVPSGYDIHSSPWKITMLLIGKPSISMGHLCHGYVSHNQMVQEMYI